MNILKIAIVITVIVLVVVIVVFALGQFEATRPIYDQIMSYVNPAKEQITTFVASPTGAITSIGGVAGLITIGGAAYSKFNSVKEQASALKTSAESQINALKTEKDNIMGTVEEYKTQATTAQQKIKELETQLQNTPTVDTAQYQSQIDKLTAQNQQLQSLIDNGSKTIAANTKILFDPIAKRYYQASVIQEVTVP